MTCIVGIRHRGGVLIGADSFGGSEYLGAARLDPKVGLVGAYGIGFTTSYRMGQLLLYGFEPPSPPRRGDMFGFIATQFVDAVRKRLADGGWKKVESARDEGGEFLVAVRGRLFVVHSDFQVAEPIELFRAIGCGEALATGALAASTGAPRTRLHLALRVAARFTGSVRAPFRFVEVPR